MAENNTEKTAETTVEAVENQKVDAHVSEAQTNPEKFLEEFDWHNYEEGIEQVADSKLAEFELFTKALFCKSILLEEIKAKVLDCGLPVSKFDLKLSGISFQEFAYGLGFAIS